MDVVGRGDGADALAHMPYQLGAQIVAQDRALLHRDVGVDALALHGVRAAHDRRLGHLRIRHERTLDLGRADAVPRHVDEDVYKRQTMRW